MKRVWVGCSDHPDRPFLTHELTADWTFVRFHKGSRGRRGNYSESELERWKRRIADWRARVEVFAYFNDDQEGFAVKNALWLKKMLGGPTAKVAACPGPGLSGSCRS